MSPKSNLCRTDNCLLVLKRMSTTYLFALLAVAALAAAAFAIYVKMAKQRGETARNVAARGNLVVLMGPNTAGKTVMFHKVCSNSQR